MHEVLGSLNSRDEATLLWLGVLTVLALCMKDVRALLPSLLRTVLSKPILVGLAAMVTYVSAVVFAVHRVGLWEPDMTKDTVIWFLGPAMVMVFNHTQAHKDGRFFRRRLLASLELAVLLGFLVNFYVFGFFVELVLVPVLFCLGALLVVSRTKPEFAQVKRLLEFVVSMAGLAFLGYTSFSIITDPGAFISEHTLWLFALPVILTIAFLPFVYALALYSGYELIFLRARFLIKDAKLAGFARRKILRACHLRLGRVNRFLNSYVRKLPAVRSESDLINLIADFAGTQ